MNSIGRWHIQVTDPTTIVSPNAMSGDSVEFKVRNRDVVSPIDRHERILEKHVREAEEPLSTV
jgi:hypothetical protein